MLKRKTNDSKTLQNFVVLQSPVFVTTWSAARNCDKCSRSRSDVRHVQQHTEDTVGDSSGTLLQCKTGCFCLTPADNQRHEQ